MDGCVENNHREQHRLIVSKNNLSVSQVFVSGFRSAAESEKSLLEKLILNHITVKCENKLNIYIIVDILGFEVLVRK